MKKISLAIVIAIMMSMFTPSVMAAATVKFLDYSDTVLSENTNGGIYPNDWATVAGSSSKAEKVTGLYGLSASDTAIRVTTGTNQTNFKYGYTGKEYYGLAKNQYLHATTSVAALNNNFDKLGIGFRWVAIGDDTEQFLKKGSITSQEGMAAEAALVSFEKNSSKVELRAFGKAVVADFNFKVNKLYKLDALLNIGANTMDIYVDGVLVCDDYDYSYIFKNIAGIDYSANSGVYLSSLQYPSLIQYSLAKNNQSVALFDNSGYTIYGNNESLPVLTAPETTITVKGYGYDANAINIVTTGTVNASQLLPNVSSSANSVFYILGADGTIKDASSTVALVTGDKLVEVIDVNGDTKCKIARECRTINVNKVSGATSWNFDNWDDSYITGAENNNMPVGWGNLNGGRNSALMSGKFGKAANDKFVAVSTTNATSWGAPPVHPSTHQLVGNYNLKQFSASVAANNTYFYQLGLVAPRADVRYTDTDGSEKSVSEVNFANNVALLAFEKDANGNVILTSWGQNITPAGFVFETNRFYKLDCVIKGNTMDAYLDGEFVKNVDFTANMSNMTKSSTTYDFTQYSNYYISQFRRIGLVQHKPVAYNGDFTAYWDDITVLNAESEIVEPSETISVVAFKKEGNNIYLGSHEDLKISTIKNYVFAKNELVFTDANGNIKDENGFVFNGDKVVEVSNGVYTAYTFVAGKPSVVEPVKTYTGYNPETEKTFPEGHDFWSTSDFYLFAEEGALGKADDDNVFKFSNSGSGANMIYSAKEPLITNTIHVSGEFAINTTSFTEVGLFHSFKTDKTDRKSLGVPMCFAKDKDGNVIISMFGTDVTPGNFKFEVNRFYKMDLCYMPNGYVDGYLDGEYLGSINYKALTTEIISKIKYFFIASHYGSRNGYVYVDNLYIDSYANGYPAIGYDRASEKTINNEGLKENGDIYVNYGVTAAELLADVTSANTIKLFDKNFEWELTGDDVVSNGAVMVEYARDGETMHYNTILMPYGDIEFVKEITEDGVVYKAMVDFANCGTPASYKVVLASYVDDKLEAVDVRNANLNDEFGRNYTVTSSLAFASDVAGRTFKAMLWDGNMAPVFVPVTGMYN